LIRLLQILKQNIDDIFFEKMNFTLVNKHII